MLPVTGDTALTYSTYSIVNAGDVVPPLLCYDNCPDANPSTWDNCNGQSCKMSKQPSHLGDRVDIGKGGECTTLDRSKLPTYVFTNIGGDPIVKVTWNFTETMDTSGFAKKFQDADADAVERIWYVSFVEIVDPGMDCDASGNEMPTLTFVDDEGVCSDLPIVTISCVSGNDVSDYRQAFHYTFDPISGKLFDVISENEAVISSDNEFYSDSWNSEYFGPFFEDSDESKEMLLCDYDSSIVCSWKAYSSLDVMYTYQSGPGTTRASLLKSDESAVLFSEALSLLYTHEGHTSNSGADYDGVLTMLAYYSPGDLEGLPQFCMDAATQQKSDQCIPSDSADATINIDDISIPNDLVFYDLDGNAYYAKARSMLETYPVAVDDSICNGLDFDAAPGAVSVDLIRSPDDINLQYPTSDELEANYLGKGDPAVIRGVVNPIYA